MTRLYKLSSRIALHQSTLLLINPAGSASRTLNGSTYITRVITNQYDHIPSVAYHQVLAHCRLTRARSSHDRPFGNLAASPTSFRPRPKSNALA